MTAVQKLQQRFWESLYPIFPAFERLARPFRLRARQNYLLGRLHPGRSLDELREQLRTRWDFEEAIVAWTDDGQVLSWRKRISFEYQYHVRVFEDGEIRGHFEYTPEAAPIWHLFRIGQEERAEDFRRFLEGHIVHEDVAAREKRLAF